jgi:DNA-binding CsgD family transcriptional regulator/tetratricopeptide (TPR) repeat protein
MLDLAASQAEGRMGKDAQTAPEPLIGRLHERDELEHLAGSIHDGARALVLIGPAGVGKTALWTYGRQAAGSVARVLTCRSAGLATRISYSALSDLLVPLSAEMESLSSDEKRALMTATHRAHFDDAAIDNTAVALAASRVLGLAAAGDPLVLAIDDLQWLDPSSTRVIGFALRRLADHPIGVLATQRETFGAEALRAALPYGRISFLDVGPLAEDEIDQLIKARMGAALLRPMVGQIYRTAAGNPLFSLELARVVLQQTKPLPVGVPLPLPNTLEELMGRRIAAVSATTRDVLLLVAAYASARLATVEEVLGHLALAGVQRAIDAGLLESDRGLLRFTHPLLAAAAYSSADLARRRRLHRRLALIATDVEERARQLSAASDLPDGQVADELEKGAAAAYARGAPEEAGALAERAVELTPAADRVAVFRRSISAADYFWEAGDSGKAAAALRQLVDDLPPGSDRALVLRRLATVTASTESFGAATRVLDVAISEAAYAPLLAATLHRDRALDIMQAGDVRESRQDASLAMQLVVAGADPDAFADAEAVYVMQAVIRADAPVDLPTRLTKLARLPDTEDRWLPSSSRHVLIAAMLKWIDDFDASRRLLSAAYMDWWDRQLDGLLMPALFQLGELECWAGRLEQARKLAQLGKDNEQRSGKEALRPMWAYPAALAAARAGDLERASALASESLLIADRTAEGRHQMRAHAVLGFIALCADDSESAVRHFNRVESLENEFGYVHPGVIRADADHIEALIMLGDLDLAESRLNTFERRAARAGTDWPQVTARRCSGLLLSATGELDAAEAALRDAIARCEHLPDPLERGRTLLAFGTLLRRQRRRSDAQVMLRRADDVFRAMGANLWATKADSEFDKAGGHTRSGSAMLTETETQVAELVAAGKSNRQIAAEIYISPKTVEAHLSRIYRKLALRSRTELAAHVLATKREARS